MKQLTNNQKLSKSTTDKMAFNLVAKEINVNKLYEIENNTLATESRKTALEISDILFNKLSQKDTDKIFKLLLTIDRLNYKTNK